MVLLNEDAAKFSGCELVPFVAVAGPVDGRVSVPVTEVAPRIVAPPFTSSVVAGVVVPMPIFAVVPAPVCEIAEFWTLVAVVNRGRALTVPPVVVTFEEVVEGAAIEAFAVLWFRAVGTPTLIGAASMKAEGGSPPKVCASPAFKAYGTLKSKIRGYSSCPSGRTPNQRASPATKISAGSPVLLVAPSWTV